MNCLEAMVETCLPVEGNSDSGSDLPAYPSMLSANSNMNLLSSSLSSLLTLGSPTEKDLQTTIESEAGIVLTSAAINKKSLHKQRSMKSKSTCTTPSPTPSNTKHHHQHNHNHHSPIP